MQSKLYAKVIVDIAVSQVDRLFTYGLAIPATVGQRVLVPFGNGNKTLEGFILEITSQPPEGNFAIKNIIKTLEPYPAIDQTQIELVCWLAKKYHCTMAQGLRLLLPAQLRGLRIAEKKLRCVSLNPALDPKAYLNSLISPKGKIRSKAAYEVIELLSQVDMPMLVSDVYELTGCNSTVIKKLTDEGVAIISLQSVYRRPYIQRNEKAQAPILTEQQTKALDLLKEGINNSKGEFLLHGVTGSGKTEVYMSAIQYAIDHGKTAIVLVPEISLTPQTVSRFAGRFGDKVAVLHSRLSAGERFDEWRRIRKGEVKVVVGARSAVFAPLMNIGIIVIDEEHENTYASETIPRYNAVEVAQKRCSISGGILVLGSATPSINAYFRVKHNKYKLIELNSRVNAKPLPNIEVIDMRAELLSGNSGIFSGRLAETLKECYNRGEQAILFLNRRGYSSFVSCRACGYVFKCESCDVSMTYHKFEGRIKCHYCGNEAAVPKLCPQCNKPYLKYNGLGTEQVEEEVKRLLPDAKCIRMDADTTRGKDSHAKLLGEFAKGSANVLIGTQMIAKGLDFPNVTLVGVVSVDAMLAMPDFRNTERTFALLTQVSGRAGRADKTGTCILQTSSPEHPVIEFARNHDYKAFYDYAIDQRQKNLYPPFSVFVRVLFTGDDDDMVKAESISFANEVYEGMVKLIKDSGAELNQILLIYAMPAPIRRIQNKQRHQVLIKLLRTKQTAGIIDCIYDYAGAKEWEYLSHIEVNPVDML